MAQLLKIASLNVRGLGAASFRTKWKEIKGLVDRDRVQLLCLQETKLSDHRLTEGESPPIKASLQAGFQLWAPAIGTAGGVAILCTKYFKGEIRDFFADTEGRWAWVYTYLAGERVLIATVYAPPQLRDKCQFWHAFSVNIPDADRLILIGDFNTVVDSPSQLASRAPYSPDALAMINVLTTMGLHDAFRMLWPHEKGITWVGPALKTCSRIDMAWLSQTAAHCLLDFSITPVVRSDHKMITITLALPTALHTRPPPSTVPGWIFSEERFRNMANQHWLYWSQLRHPDQSALQWLMDGTAALARLLKQAVLASKRARRLMAEAFIRRALELGDGPPTEDGEEEWWMQWAALQVEWEDWQIKDAESWGLRNKAQWTIAAGRMTKTFFRRLHSKRPASIMMTLQAPFQEDGPLADNTQTILQFAHEYYSYLLTDEQSWTSEEIIAAPASAIW
ncbi:hypothetical protein CBR_g30673 [Chara braunii]|uniref:Endonuclease/exonuclease/phosphatase domain-containing protein n=1 Tax=Chara braunii TaxID=69332 RepID=A0A388LDC0_CHABU|nr:hypothetical protein CBR_g30673 [Chara braunii]|eukprot:GBG80305.1 hypothetical protein CBR_g30673 [Chara braunii]